MPHSRKAAFIRLEASSSSSVVKLRAGHAEADGVATNEQAGEGVVGADEHRVLAALLGNVADERADALLHLARGLAREGDHHHLAPVRAVADEMRDLVDDGGGFPGARAGEDDDVLFLRVGDFALAGIERDAFGVRHEAG